MTFVFTEKHVLTHYVSYSSKICVSTISKTNVSNSGPWTPAPQTRRGRTAPGASDAHRERHDKTLKPSKDFCPSSSLLGKELQLSKEGCSCKFLGGNTTCSATGKRCSATAWKAAGAEQWPINMLCYGYCILLFSFLFFFKSPSSD